METPIKNVTLAFCCKENWDSFTPVDERKRHCGSCKHHVEDFTNASQEDLEKAFRSDAGVCGRFKSSQMSEAFLKIAAASLIATASIASISCGGENNINPQKEILIAKPEIEERVFMGVAIPSARDTLHMVPIIIPNLSIQKSVKAKGNND